MNRKLIGLLCLGLGLAAAWTWKLIHDVFPTFPTRGVEARSFRVRYPDHWRATDTTDPALGDDDVLVFNYGPNDRPDSHRLDRLHLWMHLDDKGTAFTALTELVDRVRKDNDTPMQLQRLTLKNGVEAQTWKSKVGLVDVAGWKRWIAFKGPNGHYYLAGYDLPYHWKVRARYNHLFETILGSMEFKSDGPKK